MINSSAASNNQNHPMQNHMLQDIQYSLCSSYIKYASEKLAVREAQLMDNTAILLSKIKNSPTYAPPKPASTTHAQKMTNLPLTPTNGKPPSSGKASTLASAAPRAASWRHSRRSSRSAARKPQPSPNTFLPTTKNSHNNSTSLIFAWKSSPGSPSSGRRGTDAKHARTKYRLEKRLMQHEQKIITLNLDNSKLKIRAQEVEKELQKEREGKSLLKSTISSTSSTYSELLTDKQKTVESRCRELKLIENAISCHLQSISELPGCRRCEIIHQIKTQIMDYRRHYEKQFDVLAKLLLKHKKTLR